MTTTKTNRCRLEQNVGGVVGKIVVVAALVLVGLEPKNREQVTWLEWLW